ncbi:DUF6460 domain-containing protein [Indioceanicola profundi]|uniref:DUF6460 domain-containing protein n=1 Tax=Indioceanicola profundi TaxID=2220096 RepID=UPI001CEC2957|nr:hypothetical protein [Indioceanicola profundi]
MKAGTGVRFVIQVLIACLLVGLFLSWFSIDPRTILQDSWKAIKDVAGLAVDFVDWAIPYILTGAVVVVPVVAVTAGLKLLRDRRPPPPPPASE